MFFRSVKVKSSSGKIHEYVRLVEAVRVKGQPRQKVIANLGRRDQLGHLLPKLRRFLEDPSLGTDDDGFRPVDSATWGPVLLTHALFSELGLFDLLDRVARASRRGRPPAPDFADRVLVLVANRLTKPLSEHGLARWLETHFAADREGRRYLPRWKQKGRVQVDHAQLMRWYRTLDRLVEHKDAIELGVFSRLKTLFSLRPDLVFYDITSTYFEGGSTELRRHGYSRDGKPRNPQLVVGMVMVDGLPIAHHVFAGNRRDSTTVKEVLDDLADRFDFSRVIFVGDRGMVTKKNLKHLREKEQGYLVGLTRRRRPKVEKLLDRVREDMWIPCPVGITASEQEPPPVTKVQEVEHDEKGVRAFVIDSEERRAYESERRQQAMTRTQRELDGLVERVRSGRLVDEKKIAASATRILGRRHGQRYFDWKLEGGVFTYFEHPVNLPREKKIEGRYLIQTEEPDLTPLEAVERYKELAEVERGFRQLKDPLGVRPIYHQNDDRSRAHIFVAALAFLLDRVLERKLKKAGVPLSSTQAIHALETIHHVRVEVGEKERRGVTPGTARAQSVIKALGLKTARPPAPAEGRLDTVW
jgi:transposase